MSSFVSLKRTRERGFPRHFGNTRVCFKMRSTSTLVHLSDTFVYFYSVENLLDRHYLFSMNTISSRHNSIHSSSNHYKKHKKRMVFLSFYFFELLSSIDWVICKYFDRLAYLLVKSKHIIKFSWCVTTFFVDNEQLSVFIRQKIYKHESWHELTFGLQFKRINTCINRLVIFENMSKPPQWDY